jgi:hypothetical protein
MQDDDLRILRARQCWDKGEFIFLAKYKRLQIEDQTENALRKTGTALAGAGGYVE